MTDRQPGAPGQYKAVIEATELLKMQAGEQFTITMTRDDQPLVEGTPYNKASVLPDDLANKLCPSITDPTPADALNGLRKKRFTVTLYVENWAEDSGQYKQTVAVSSVTGDEYESVTCWPEYTGDKATDEEIQSAAAAVTRAETGTGSVTFVCLSDLPSGDIPVVVEVSR